MADAASSRRASRPMPIPRARSSSALDADAEADTDTERQALRASASSCPEAASPTTSSASDASSSASQSRRASEKAGAARLRRDTSLKIFLPADDLALKAILSPPLGRRADGKDKPAEQAAGDLSRSSSRSSSSSSSGADGPRLQKSKSATAVGATAASNLFDKLLFRTPAGSSDGSGNTPSDNTSAGGNGAALSPSTRAKTSAGSLVEEDLEMVNSGVVVMNTNLPPPPFANMFACDSCREDIGSLLTKGRHHCRNCGGSFCADCSSRACVVPFRAYLDRGDLRVCDACFHRIQNFQAQVRSTQVTWGGLPPPPTEAFRRAFRLPEDEDPVTIFNCSLFLDITPYYGHLFLTRRHFCFQPYLSRSKADAAAVDNVDVSSSYAAPGTPRAPPRALKVPYERIVSLVKPQFYYINGLQVKTDAKHKFFLAEFNGLRDMCFLRLDQLIRARQQQPSAAKQTQAHHHHHHHHRHYNQQSGGEMARLSAQDLLQQAMVRRKSYRKLMEEQSAAAPASTSSSVMLTPADSSDVLNFASQQSSVGFFDIDDADMGGSGEFATDTGDISDDTRSSLLLPSGAILEEDANRHGRDMDDDDDDGAGSSAECSNASSSEDECFEPLPPDEPLSRTTILLDCDLRADVKQVFDLLWNDDVGREFTVANLERARDVDISVSKWRAIGEEERAEVGRGFVVSTERDYAMCRRVASKHPPRTSFPGLPAYAECEHMQRFRLDASSQGGDKWDRFVVTDLMRMQKIPFCDYFEIETRWVFSRDGKNYCHVQAGLVVNFLKATWFKSQITSSTKSESKEALENWAKQAIDHLGVQQQRLREAGASSSLSSPTAVPAPGPSPPKTRVRVGISPAKQSSGDHVAPPPSSESAIARAWTTATPATIDMDDDGVAADVRGLLSSASYTQWLVLALLLYCLLVIRSQQFQIQQLAATTTLLLDKLQPSAPGSDRLGAATAPLMDVCQQQVIDGARRALEQYFQGAGAPP